MPNKWILILLSVLVALATGEAIYRLSDAQLSSYGSVFAAAASLLAVIWFTGSLWYQSQQLREQRTQFLAEFKHLHEEGRRNALLLVRDILSTAESKALAANPKIHSLSELTPLYIHVGDLKGILQSDDLNVVNAAIESWMRKEGPAMILMRGIKSAAQVYFLAIGNEDVDYSKEPEEFVFIYGPQLWPLPFFDAFQAPAVPLAEMMVRLGPDRKAVIVASQAVMVKLMGEKVMKMDLIREEIKKHVAKGYALPKIAQGLFSEEAG